MKARKTLPGICAFPFDCFCALVSAYYHDSDYMEPLLWMDCWIRGIPMSTKFWFWFCSLENKDSPTSCPLEDLLDCRPRKLLTSIAAYPASFIPVVLHSSFVQDKTSRASHFSLSLFLSFSGYDDYRGGGGGGGYGGGGY